VQRKYTFARVTGRALCSALQNITSSQQLQLQARDSVHDQLRRRMQHGLPSFDTQLPSITLVQALYVLCHRSDNFEEFAHIGRHLPLLTALHLKMKLTARQRRDDRDGMVLTSGCWAFAALGIQERALHHMLHGLPQLTSLVMDPIFARRLSVDVLQTAACALPRLQRLCIMEYNLMQRPSHAMTDVMMTQLLQLRSLTSLSLIHFVHVEPAHILALPRMQELGLAHACEDVMSAVCLAHGSTLRWLKLDTCLFNEACLWRAIPRLPHLTRLYIRGIRNGGGLMQFAHAGHAFRLRIESSTLPEQVEEQLPAGVELIRPAITNAFCVVQ
jgi:hypothetical protein